MSGLTLYTYDWVPEPPRGYVRDIRIRWALKEAKLPYRVKGVPFKDRAPRVQEGTCGSAGAFRGGG